MDRINDVTVFKNGTNMPLQARSDLVPDTIPDWRIESWREVIRNCFSNREYLWKEPHRAADSGMACRERQLGLAELLLSISAEYLMPLRFEQPLTSNAIRSRLRKFGALVDRSFLGRNWCKSSNRSVWIAVVEDQCHVHIPLRPPERRT